MVKLERSFTVEIPGSEKKSEEVGGGGTFETKAGVFPMTVEGFLIDVFIGEVNAAGVADFAVDNDNLAVVTVIVEAVNAGIEFVGWGAMDAKGFEVMVVVGGESEDTADVVVHDVNFNTLLDFGLEDREDLMPHFAGADDEEFEHDELLGGFEVEEKLFEISFAAREVSGFVILGEGNVVGLANIVGLESGGRAFDLEVV